MPRHVAIPDGWIAQYNRTRRLQARIGEDGQSGVDYEDALFCFFMNAWALKDWVKNDQALPQAARGAVVRAVHADSDLQVLRDLANGSKHLILNDPKVAGRLKERILDVRLGATPEVTNWWMFESTRGVEEGHAIAVGAMLAWDRILRAHGLLCEICEQSALSPRRPAIPDRPPRCGDHALEHDGA